jgi:hypothetical protein
VQVLDKFPGKFLTRRTVPQLHILSHKVQEILPIINAEKFLIAVLEILNLIILRVYRRQIFIVLDQKISDPRKPIRLHKFIEHIDFWATFGLMII